MSRKNTFMINPGRLERASEAMLLGILCISIFIACGRKEKNASDEYQKMEGVVWNTAYHITYKGAPELRDSVLAVLDEVSATFNVFNDSSLVSQVNRNDSTKVNNDFIEVYAMSMKVNRLSGGAFDPTLGPLIKAWGFGKGHTPTADTLRVDSILKYTGIAKTRISKDQLIKEDSRTEFNFSALAKGYGCDKIGRMLSRNGSENWLVEIGGEIAAKGCSPSEKDWHVSVDRPIIQSDSIIHESQVIIAFTDMGMATSGNYRNFHTDGTRRFGHTISPETGRPAETDVLSATVLAPTAMMADALATAFMAMGSDKARQLTGRLKLPVMLVLADSTVFTSPRFEKLIVE